MLKLAERMTNNFCGGVSASTAQTWVTLAGSGADDVRVVIRKSVDDPGRPPGIVLSAATSLRLPVPPARIFQFLRDERYRTEVKILHPICLRRLRQLNMKSLRILVSLVPSMLSKKAQLCHMESNRQGKA